jgi:hypothetical protein
MNVFVNVWAALSPLVVLALAGVGWLYRHERERRENVELQVSERKHQAYLSVLNIYFDLMKPENRGKQPDTRLVTNMMFDANKELILFGSDEVVTLYLNWFQELRQGSLNLERLGELVVAIRRDMGHPRTDLTAETVLRHLITDYDEAKAKGELTHVPVPPSVPTTSPTAGKPAPDRGVAAHGERRSGTN